ncbi:TRAP transporter small permease [Paracoccus nototheniae]|uniref:TRAP transporter small permease protein n=1 Tax=Paracoccus nototheniae TaxID=2489002 RepID=A0ABW4DZS8_9RHOB|nr:TRAP transporter small permease [Paracoccus nototheniae]
MTGLDRLIWRAVDVVILGAVLGMVALISLQVGSRLAGISVPWTEELSRFMFIWTIWMGLAASFRSGAHPSLQLIPETAPRPLLLIMRVAQVLACVTLFAVVGWHGWSLLNQQIRFGEQSPILQVGMWWATLPLVLGSGLAILGALLNGLRPLSPPPAEPAP